ncbi:hypothetical protein SAMN05660841_01644 [Sphingobacterium nematocida]|uniref:Uncharacterized protein n=1 Tax=Sphingobacterium nematocida TaxID=1513896 RepID=A0A1T5CY96_9SPHI|nr:hypothetical protein [Sphingobacterium nematocida]SKB64331.1 hypothetical protein SAMN05660841_01644 [Sphingobacterium nematocida]
MAKQIKALKCPHCGSVKKQTIKEDHYLCNHCGTEYFLDNDDINVNIKHQYGDGKSNGLDPKTKKTIFLVVAGVLFFIVFSSVLRTCGSRNGQSPSVTYLDNSPKEKEYVERVKDYLAFTAYNTKNPTVLFIINRSKDGYGREGAEYIARFYDPLKEKTVSDIALPGWKDDFYLRSRVFSDEGYYICADKSNKVYKIDPAKNELIDMTSTFFADVPEFSSGIATLKFTQDKEGDGFNIMTNDGKEYYYYPLVRKIYKDHSERREAGTGLSSLLSGASSSIYYTFSEKSRDYPEEKVQLVKYWYKNNPGYPIMLPYSHQVIWEKVYQYPKKSGIYYGSFPFTKKLFKEPRIAKFIDLTPDRLYFEAKVAYQDSANLYITGLPNANPEGNPYIQKINTENGKIVWTFTPQSDNYSFDYDMYGYDGGLVFSYYDRAGTGSSNRLVVIANDGTVLKNLDKDEIFKK